MIKEWQNDVGFDIRAWRKSAGLTIEEAAFKLYLTPRNLRAYESKNSAPVETVMNMGKVYGKVDAGSEYCNHKCPIGECERHHYQRKNILEAIIQQYNAHHSITEEDWRVMFRIAEDKQITPDEFDPFTKTWPKFDWQEHSIGETKLSVAHAIPIPVIMGKEKQSSCRPGKANYSV